MDPAWLHEAARHTTHCTESLSVAQEVFRTMTKEHEALQSMSDHNPVVRASIATNRFIQQRLQSTCQILGALKMRSDACTERLRNENSLVRIFALSASITC